MQTEQMHVPGKRKKWIVLGIILLIVLIAGINITIMQNKNKNSSANLKFSTAAEKELSNTKLIAGQIMPSDMETIYADPTKGQIKELYVKKGQTVSKGQKLFSYENAELSIQLQQLAIDQKTANIQMEQVNQKIAAIQKQIQAAKNSNAPQTTIDSLESQLQDLQFQQQTAQLTIEKNNLQKEDLQSKLNDLIVYSRTAGIVQLANKDAGQTAGQSAAAQTNPIVQIVSKDPFVIQGTLTELQKSQIQPNQPVTVTAQAVSNKNWKGKISEISEYPTSNELGQSTATTGVQQTQNISYYNYKAALDSQDGLSPGFHVAVQVNLSTKKMLVIPSSSIVESGNSKYVYLVKNNKLHKQTVTTGMGDGNSTEVLKGVKAGDKVVNNPSKNVYDGMDVKTK